jgi:non-canonical purine NTP pyrophosphatase (RdgB/HAM1 family)
MKDSFNSSLHSGKGLIIATTNAGKLDEICSVLSFLEISLLSLSDFAVLPEAPEAGSTFEENARGKAVFFFDHLKRPVLAEDSGLVLPALGGFPGVHSSRIAADDSSRIRCVLDRLEELERDFPAPNSTAAEQMRSAYYVSSLVFFNGDNTLVTEGRCHGKIQRTSSGTQGFGYDPIFLPDNSSKTFGQMDPTEKSKISHRGIALKAMIPFLIAQFRPELSQAAQENGQQ